MVEVNEKVVYNVLTKSRDELCKTYEPCVYEHCASRWLRLLPPVPEPLGGLALSSTLSMIYDLTDMSKAQAVAQSAARKHVLKQQGLKSEAKPVASAKSTPSITLADQADKAFDPPVNEKRLLSICGKPPGVTITKVRNIMPDTELQHVQYATAVLTPKGHKMPYGSFAVASTSSSEACFYEPVNPAPIAVGEGEVYAVPKSILIIQKLASEAPKKWLCFRASKKHSGVLLATELTDLRYQITKDSSMDASNNATVILCNK